MSKEIVYQFVAEGDTYRDTDQKYYGAGKWDFLPAELVGAIHHDANGPARRVVKIEAPTIPSSEWVLWSERPPTREDADKDGMISTINRQGFLGLTPYEIGESIPGAFLYWRSTAPPQPTDETEALAAAEVAWETSGWKGSETKIKFINFYVEAFLAGAATRKP